MGLFSALLESSAVETEQSSPTSKSLKLPTVVQIFTDNPFPLILDTATADTKEKSQPPSYAALHYTAVQCCTDADLGAYDDEQAPAKGLRASSSSRKDQAMLVPDLGVWNCRIDDKLSDVLLPIAAKSSCVKTFCMAVDLSKQANNVEPSITKLQQALVRFLIEHGENQQNDESQLATQTTTLYQLRSVQFGLGDKDEKSASKLSSAAPDESDRNVKIALQICVKMPPENDDNDYRVQQINKLLIYHLHKYAAALNASVVFVNSVSTSRLENGDEPKQQQPSLTIKQLPIVWKAFAQGKPVWSEPLEGIDSTDYTATTVPGDEGKEGKAAEGGYSLIYGPDNHNIELIESVLLRNASYPGHWDAATDSVWKVLPPETKTKKSNSKTGTAETGDGGWLEELRASISTPAAGMQTPPPKSASKDAQSANKTPNDAAVSSFFEGLLK